MTTSTTPLPKTSREESLRVRLIPFIDRYGVLLLVLAMGVVSYLLEPKVFLTWGNISNIFRQIAFNAMLALGEFLVILTAGIDLSVGSILALAMMSTAVLGRDGYPTIVLLIVPFVVGAACGLPPMA